MDAASQILASLRDFGWPLLAFAIVAPISTFLMPRKMTSNEPIRRLGLTAIIIAAMMITFFLLAEGGHIVQVARYRPAWGLLAGILCLSALAAAVLWFLKSARSNAVRISLLDQDISNLNCNRGTHTVTYLVVSSWVVGLIASIAWLTRISHGK